MTLLVSQSALREDVAGWVLPPLGGAKQRWQNSVRNEKLAILAFWLTLF
jgi:hypothetical protein